ncbi:MAG: C_GCAxxG_C_C family protein [Actinobacteria bacterium]|nr:C_GCAxxG_C_C family protein [Actinomycetota bacterium]
MEMINGYTREKAMDMAYRIGFEGEANRFDCAQEVFHAVSSVLGIKNHMIFRCLSPLEAGGADTTYGSCGAFSGALVVFGYYFGRTYELWQQGKTSTKSSILGQKLYKRFEEKYGTIICREIHKKIFGTTFNLMDDKNLGLDMQELDRFNAMGAHVDKCPHVVGLSAAWTVDILWDEIPKDIDVSEIKGYDENKDF